jgi:hypothetical protein
LSLKLLSNLQKEKNLNLDEPEVFNMSEEELKLMENLLVKHHNIIVFMQQMNQFRSKGFFVMRSKAYEVFSNLFNLIMNIVTKNNDIYTAKYIIILSQTYFYKDSNKKEYLQMKIIDNKIFKNLKFWEDIFNLEMNLEIQKIVKTDSLDSNETDYSTISFDEIRERNRKKYGKLAFGTIMSVANNMIDFGIKPKEAYEVLAPKIEHYKLDNPSIEAIKAVLNINSEGDEEEKRNNIIINKNEEEVVKKDNDNKNEIKEEIKDNDDKNEIKEEIKDNDNKNEINENQKEINENKNENKKKEKNENIININQEE